MIGLLGCSTSSPVSTTTADVLLSEVPVSESPASTGDRSLDNHRTNESLSSPPPSSSRAQSLPITAQTTLNNIVIDLEVATTPSQQAIGLMYRPSLSDNHGMLFPFSPARPVNFWMRNVEINLDMVFIYGGEVIAIASQVPPCRTEVCPTYGPPGIPVDFVLELRGGRAGELGIELGDSVPITFLE
ncbi:MAG: DUF192 domain-containing protein [Symploca sp. SIO2B6]|nr:DUF192 domain-containing protein [Symploca sp. SIO2B6]